MSNNLTKLLSLFLSFCLILEQGVFAQTIDLSRYFARNSASVVPQSDKFRPLHLRYISYDNQANDFKILLDKGDFFNQQTPKLPNSSTPKLEEAAQELMKYFFIGLSLPNDKFWVNLRPDYPDNILDPDLEKTDIGRIFLEADLQLKKDTAGMTSPQTPEGKAYWDKLYKKAEELFGTENITIPTITRPWIVPNEIIIREAPDNAYIYKATLKVMLEEDYFTARGGSQTAPMYQQYAFSDPRLKELNEYSTQLIKETIIPKLTYAVNTAKRYAPLRQVYYSLILAQWFKQKYGSVRSTSAPGTRAPVNSYVDRIDSGNLTNLTSKEPYDKQTYFKQYQKSFKDGEYNLQEPVYTPMGQSIRRYISGGVVFDSKVGMINGFVDIIPAKRLTSVSSALVPGGFKNFFRENRDLKRMPPATESLTKTFQNLLQISYSEGFSITFLTQDQWNTFSKQKNIKVVNNVSAKYFDYYLIKDNQTAKTWIMVPSLAMHSNINIDDFFKSRVEISSRFPLLSKSRILIFWDMIYYRLFGAGLSFEDLFDRWHKRNIKLFIEYIEHYRKGNIYISSQNPLNSPDYSHIRLFAWLYYQQIQLISDYLKKHYSGDITILDLGSGPGYFIFVADFFLKEYKDRIHYIGADKNDSFGVSDLLRIAGKEKISNITAIQADFLRNPDILFGADKNYDFIIINHVLEHLSDNNHFNIKKWQEHTKHTLFLSVPYERQNPSKMSDHEQVFDETTLISLIEKISPTLPKTVTVNLEHIKSGLVAFINSVSASALIKSSKNLIGSSSLFKSDSIESHRINPPVSNAGGIAFNALPIRTESVVSSALGALLGARAFKGDLDAEWVQIQDVFNAGVRPSIQRLSEYAAAAAASSLAEDKIDQVRVMLADILRRDEESQKSAPAEESCKQLLRALESA